MNDVIVLGGGASGMAAALTALERGCTVTLIERQARLGRKLLTTGNGRCNLTNEHAGPDHYHGERPEFCRYALEQYPAAETLAWFAAMGLETVTESDGRVYPRTNTANSVLDVLRAALARYESLTLLTGDPVSAVKHKNGVFTCALESGAAVQSSRLVLACGGAAGSKTDPSQIDFHGEPFIVTQSSVGRTFDVAEAEKAWAAASYGDTVTIPMTVTKPEHTTEEINDMLFRDALSKNWTLVRLWNRDYCNEVRTSLSGSSADRISNVKKACGLLDGLVLIPGQTLSFNDTLGERTEANGWKPATAYANGEVRQEYGGGICQVSSTLYNAVLYANLEIVERACHQFQVGYLPWGMDATVSWGWPDFKFRNDAEYPVKIHAWVDEETNECCVQILGTDVKHQYVLMQFNNWEVFDETGTYFDANGNPLSVGMAAATWRLVFNDGDDYNTATPISKEYEAYSTYNYHTEDIEARNVPQG